MHHDCDVIIVGAGPTGLTGAHLLGAQGIRTLLIEKNPGTVQQPRAVSIDDEALRTMQAAGVLDDILPDINLDYGFVILDPKGRELYRVSPSTREYGFPKRNAFVQPIFERTLREALPRHASVETRFSTEVLSIREDDDGVTVQTTDSQGRQQSLRARYLVGTDGGRSFVRQQIGATLQGSTYDARWLIVDLEGTRDRTRESNVYSDPARPTVSIPGPDGRRRFEFMLHPHEDAALAEDEAYIRGLLDAFGPDRDATIVRKQVYTFHARVADRWQTRRVFLAGDAAHLTPPFAGQGVNSAFRDIHNLSWKLAAVVQGRLGPHLLASYQAERAPHAQALIDLAVSNGKLIMPARGLRWRFTHLAYRLKRHIPRIREYYAQMKNKPQASYHDGFLLPNPTSTAVGRLVPQPQLETRDRQLQRMDDLIGPGFALLVIGSQAQAHAQQLAQQDWGLPGLRQLAIVPRGFNLDAQESLPAARDVADVFRGGKHTQVLLVRPDRYVAFAADYHGDAPSLATQVRGLVQSTWATSVPQPPRAVPAMARQTA